MGCQSETISGSSEPFLPPLSFKGTASAWVREAGLGHLTTSFHLVFDSEAVERLERC